MHKSTEKMDLFLDPPPAVIIATTQSKEYTFEQMHKLGFVSKDDNWDWSEQDDVDLDKYLQEIHKDPSIVHVKDPYYFISHYRFHGKISTKAVQKRVRQLRATHLLA